MIGKSVGLGEANFARDVKTVQHLLNLARAKLGLSHLPLLTEDGVAGKRTLEAIRTFQQDVMRLHSPDGRIDPGGKTIRGLEWASSGLAPQLAPVLSASSPASALVSDPRIKAMLDVLGFTEGTGTNYGKVVNGLVLKSPFYPELVGKRNVSITDFSRHPDILVEVRPGLNSTAAGRYQFLIATWNGLSLPNFMPENQDQGAVQLMKWAKMIASLLVGDLTKAVQNGASTWASLPTNKGFGAYSGQGARSMDDIRDVYNKALKKYQSVGVSKQ